MQPHTIHCTVGILTYNSAATLTRALESVANFSDILIADGGSTDETCAIAERFGARVISQMKKGIIDDFSRERNNLLDHAREDWFFWLDSDEFISPDLRDEIAQVTAQTSPEFLFYRIRIVRTNPDGTKHYRDWKPVYQVRLFSRTSGRRFVKKIHEQVDVPAGVPLGTLMGAWCVPVTKTDFASYKKAVDYRLAILARELPPKTIRHLFKKAVRKPFSAACSVIARRAIEEILLPHRDLIPLSFERNRLYAQWALARETWRAYWEK